MRKYHIPVGENANAPVVSAEDYEKAGYLPSLGYVRVSTEGQSSEDRYGIDAQKAAIKRYAMGRRYYIKKWFVDVCSGVSDERPELENVLYYEKAPETVMPPFSALTYRPRTGSWSPPAINLPSVIRSGAVFTSDDANVQMLET